MAALRKPEHAYLHDNFPKLLLNLLLCALEALPEVVADAAALQQRAAGLLRRADLDDAVDVLDGPPQQRCPQHAVGHLGRLLLARLRLQVQQRQVDVPLQMLREPGREVRAFGCRKGRGWLAIMLFRL